MCDRRHEVITPKTARRTPLRDELCPLAEQIPSDKWSTYGDLARVLHTHPRAVAHILRLYDVPNAHRILLDDGRLSPGFAVA